MKIKTRGEIIRKYTESFKLNAESMQRYLDVDSKERFIAVEDLLKLKDKINRALVDNSKCDCTLVTTKYKDILDVLLWFELRKANTKSKENDA